MAQEEQNQRCSNSSSGGGCNSGGVRSSSKRLKQKKIPQRGLGVAQLEKIRIEEQQKKEAALAAILTSSSTMSTTSSSSCFSLPLPNYHHNKSSSSTHFSPSSPNSLLRSAPQIPNIEVSHSSNVSNTANPINGGCGGGGGGGFEIGWSSIPVPGCTNFTKLWNPCDNIHDLESHKLDQGTTSHSNLPTYEPNNTVWPLPPLMHRAQQFQQPSPMVNVSSRTSSSSAMNFQMEPPSNQSFCGNFTHMWPEEEKMVGLKRPYPFSLDNPLGPSFQCKFPAFVAPIRSDESTSCGNGGTFTLEQDNRIFRDVPSYSSVIYESNSKKSNKEVGNFRGDFLSLAPPATSLSTDVSIFKHSSAFQPTSHGEFSKYETVPFHMMLKESMDYSTHNHEPSGSIQRQPFYSFFPPAKTQNGQAISLIDNCNGEFREGVDLNLKL